MSTPNTAPSSAPVVNTAIAPGQPNIAPTDVKAIVTPAEIRKMKLKIDGADIEMSESEVIALAQQGKSSGKKFQEAAQMRKQAEEILSTLKANPKAAFEKLGIDVRKFSEETLIEILTNDAMSPEEKRSKEMETKLRKYEKDEKDAADKKQSEELQALEEKHLTNYDQVFVKALNDSGLPKNQFTVKRMAELQLTCVKKGYDLDATQLAKLVREDYENEIKSLYSSSDGEQLMALLGETNVKKLSKAQIAKLKAASPRYSTPEPKKETVEAPKMSFRQLQKQNRGR